MVGNEPFLRYIPFLRQRPHAMARVLGSAAYPGISGTVSFYQTERGVLVAAEICGLPHTGGPCGGGIFAFHIHSGGQCSGNEKDPFANALAHYDRDDCPHPAHAGDLPPLFENRGYAFQMFLTGRFSLCEVIEKTVIIHSGPDDFTSQPSGNAGSKIACGQIRPLF